MGSSSAADAVGGPLPVQVLALPLPRRAPGLPVGLGHERLAPRGDQVQVGLGRAPRRAAYAGGRDDPGRLPQPVVLEHPRRTAPGLGQDAEHHLDGRAGTVGVGDVLTRGDEVAPQGAGGVLGHRQQVERVGPERRRAHPHTHHLLAVQHRRPPPRVLRHLRVAERALQHGRDHGAQHRVRGQVLAGERQEGVRVRGLLDAVGHGRTVRRRAVDDTTIFWLRPDLSVAEEGWSWATPSRVHRRS